MLPSPTAIHLCARPHNHKCKHTRRQTCAHTYLFCPVLSCLHFRFRSSLQAPPRLWASRFSSGFLFLAGRDDNWVFRCVIGYLLKGPSVNMSVRTTLSLPFYRSLRGEPAPQLFPYFSVTYLQGRQKIFCRDFHNIPLHL